MTEQEMLAKIERTETCWIWHGSALKAGYGRARVGDTLVSIHRFMYERQNGPVAKGLYVCHKCDNPRCVNPDHLFAGTSKDNQVDCSAKGRHGMRPSANESRRRRGLLPIYAGLAP